MFLEIILTIVRCTCTISGFNQKSLAWFASLLAFRYVPSWPLWPASPIFLRVRSIVLLPNLSFGKTSYNTSKL